jgi:hypothetical protein
MGIWKEQGVACFSYAGQDSRYFWICGLRSKIEATYKIREKNPYIFIEKIQRRIIELMETACRVMVVRGWVVGEVGDMDQREQTFSYKRVSSV